MTLASTNDSRLLRTAETTTGTVAGQSITGGPAYNFWYDDKGRMLAQLSQNTGQMTCLGQAQNGLNAEREDFVYLFGMPVAVLFSSTDMSPSDCGLNFIVPNHLGAPLRYLDNTGLVTQSPEFGPFGDTGGPPAASNGPQFSDLLVRFDPSSYNGYPLGGWTDYTSPTCSSPDCPVQVYQQSIGYPGAAALQLSLDIHALGACSDSIVIQGSGGSADSETIPSSTTGRYLAQPHSQPVTVTLLSDSTQCSSTCTCSTGTNEGFTVDTATVSYSTATDPIPLGLPGMYEPDGAVWNNWHRYYLGPFYASPDPIMSDASVVKTMTTIGIPSPSYGYAASNPLSGTDPSGQLDLVACIECAVGYYQDNNAISECENLQPDADPHNWCTGATSASGEKYFYCYQTHPDLVDLGLTCAACGMSNPFPEWPEEGPGIPGLTSE